MIDQSGLREGNIFHGRIEHNLYAGQVADDSVSGLDWSR